MKKHVAIFMIVFGLSLLLFLCGCASTTAVPTTVPTTDSDTTVSSQKQSTALLKSTLAEPITTTAPETTEEPKASVLSIPGAYEFDETDKQFQTVVHGRYDYFNITQKTEQRQAWAEQLKQNYFIVIGTLKDYTSVLVKDGDGYYHVAAFEIEVQKASRGITDQTISAVYTCRYEKSKSSQYIPSTKFPIGQVTNTKTKENVNMSVSTNMFYNALEVSREIYPLGYVGVFFLQNADGKQLTLDNQAYSLSDYADYVMDAHLVYDGNFLSSDFWHFRTGFPFSFIEDAFENTEPEPNLPNPTPPTNEKYDHIDIINDEGYVGILDMDGSYFELENTCAELDGHAALVINMTDEYSMFSYLFAVGKNQTTGKTTYELVPSYTYFITIEGKQFEIKRASVIDNTASKLVYFDLGDDFSFDLFDYDENGQYTFKEVRLEIYRPTDIYTRDLFCFADLSNGTYTHTKP